jgi:hypothetical protein
MDLVYESLVKHAETPKYSEIVIIRKSKELLGISFTHEETPITGDKRIVFPLMMVMIIQPNSVAEKYGLRLGTQIIKINDKEVTPDNYHKVIVESEDIKLLVNDSYCMIYQSLLREGVKFNYQLD